MYCRLALVLLSAILAPGIAQSRECQGTVHGLSSTYDTATGSGFLAVREMPNSSSAKLAELFNGDTVFITGRQGGWYSVELEGGSDEGWVSAKWLENSCSF